jgi:C-terminal processing protease CtpA/Prc
MLVQGNIALGTERYRIHNGYAPQVGNTSGGYTSAFVTEAPVALTGQAASKKPLAILLDEKTPSQTALWSGLQTAGAKIVQVGKGNNDGARVHPMVLGDGVRVRVRTTEFVHPNGGATFQADVQLPSEGARDEQIIAAALTALNAPRSEKATPTAAAAPAMRTMKDNSYPQMSFPSEEYRLLALFRYWNVINYFFPYKHLTDKPWHTVLTDFIPRFLANKTQLEYEMTVAEMVARLQDTHGFVRGLRTLDAHLGDFTLPLFLRVASGKLTIEGIPNESGAAGLKVGDVIVAVDGESIAQRVAHLAQFKSYSTLQAAHRSVYSTVLRGAKDSLAKLRVMGADGQTREVEVARTTPLGGTISLAAPRKTPIYQVLPNGYGYIDLARLPLVDAHKAMDAIMNTPGLIFDMRGYPNGTAWEIGPRLTEKKNVTAAQFRRPYQAATAFDDEDLADSAPNYMFEQKLPLPKGAIYKGKVVMLINEDAISQSEHTCLFFEAATNVTFIGSPTNGANGDVTNLVLPGGISVGFSGHDVRHADGRQLQRVGIQPHIKVEPTPNGLREGRDEVLEAAVKFLQATAQK